MSFRKRLECFIYTVLWSDVWSCLQLMCYACVVWQSRYQQEETTLFKCKLILQQVLVWHTFACLFKYKTVNPPAICSRCTLQHSYHQPLSWTTCSSSLLHTHSHITLFFSFSTLSCWLCSESCTSLMNTTDSVYC